MKQKEVKLLAVFVLVLITVVVVIVNHNVGGSSKDEKLTELPTGYLMIPHSSDVSTYLV